MPDVLIAGNNSTMNIYEELYREYLENRILVLNADIDDNIIDDYVLYILKWNKEDIDIPIEKRKPIWIYISSPGGNTFDANIMVDIIMQSKTPIYGVALDLVASAAYVIYLACHERYAFSSSAFLQHEGEMAIENSRSKFKQTAAFFNNMENRSKDFILSRTNMTSEFYDSIYETEYWMFAADAKELGVVHKIVGEDCSIDDIY